MGNTTGGVAKTIWRWCETRWRWLGIGVTVLLSFLYGFFRRPKIGLIPSTKADDAVRRQEDQLREEAELKAQEIADKAARERETQVIVLKEEVKDLADDLDAVNTYILDVGEDVRKP